MRVKSILKNIIEENYTEAKKLINEELYIRGNIAINTLAESYGQQLMKQNLDSLEKE